MALKFAEVTNLKNVHNLAVTRCRVGLKKISDSAQDFQNLL